MPQHMEGPAIGDAFGAGLMACLERGAEPGAVREVIERSDGWIDTGDMARYFARPEQWSEVDWWACNRAEGRVLDIGAGAGRHAVHLQFNHHDVVALDVSPLAAEVCRRRGCSSTFAGAVEEIARATVEPFDTFLLLGNNLGLLRDREYAPRFLDTLASLARPEARILGTCIDPYVTENAVHRAYHAANREAGRMGGQIRMRFRHERMATEWMDYLFMSLDELRALVFNTQWEIADVFPQGWHYAAELRLRG